MIEMKPPIKISIARWTEWHLWRNLDHLWQNFVWQKFPLISALVDCSSSWKVRTLVAMTLKYASPRYERRTARNMIWNCLLSTLALGLCWSESASIGVIIHHASCMTLVPWMRALHTSTDHTNRTWWDMEIRMRSESGLTGLSFHNQCALVVTRIRENNHRSTKDQLVIVLVVYRSSALNVLI